MSKNRKVYQWTMFFTETNGFEYFIGADKEKVYREAWQRYCEERDHAEEVETLVYASADTFEEFCEDTEHCIDTDGCGWIELNFIEYEI